MILLPIDPLQFAFFQFCLHVYARSTFADQFSICLSIFHCQCFTFASLRPIKLRQVHYPIDHLPFSQFHFLVYAQSSFAECGIWLSICYSHSFICLCTPSSAPPSPLSDRAICHSPSFICMCTPRSTTQVQSSLPPIGLVQCAVLPV